MAPTDNDKGKSLPKSFRPSMYLCGKTVNFEKDSFSVWFVRTSHFGFSCQRTEKRASDRNVKRVVRLEKGFLSRHFGILYAQLLFRFRTKKGGKGASA